MNINLYTDCACTGNPGPGGMGFVIIIENDSEPTIQSRPSVNCFRRTTNNRMEILSVARALRSVDFLLSNERAKEYLKDRYETIRSRETNITVNVYSDSQLVVNSINAGWSRKSNRDLWDKVDEQIDILTATNRVKINFIKVKGHEGNKWNEIADRLAVEASFLGNSPSAKADKVYEAISPIQEELPEIADIVLKGHNTNRRSIIACFANGPQVTVTRIQTTPNKADYETTPCSPAEKRAAIAVAIMFASWLKGMNE